MDTVASAYTYANYRQAVAAGQLSNPGGVPGRRTIAVLFTEANATGNTAVPIRGAGCFFLRQPLDNGVNASICAEFVTDCELGGAVPQPNPPANAGGFFEIILYKDSAGDYS